MNLKSLSDQELLESTLHAAKDERHSTTVVLHHLLEVEARRLFGPKYTSLHEYAVKELKYSHASAQRRIDAMRVLKAVPEVDAKIESGSLNLSTLCQAQTFFRQEKMTPENQREVLTALEDQSSRQVERELIQRATEPMVLKRDRVRAVSDTLSELKCLVTDETLNDLEKLRGLLAHKHPHLKMGELLALVAKLALEALDPGKEPKRKPSRRNALPASEMAPKIASEAKTRYIPALTRREVWRRALGKCQSCGSVHWLQIDHIQPHARGGSNQIENLRLLCFHCNQREADQKLGRAWMGSMRAPTLPPRASAPRAP